MKPMKKCRFSISNTCATNEKIASIEYCSRYNAESLKRPNYSISFLLILCYTPQSYEYGTFES